MSIPINFRPVVIAAIPVVELPVNGSKTKAFGVVDAYIIRFKRFNGFWVGCLP